MKPTKLWSLATYAIGAAVFGLVLSRTLVNRGFAVPVSPVNLPITLAAIGVVILLMAIPMIRYRAALKEAKRQPKRVPSIYAFRVVILAKASAIAGSLFLGWHAGVLLAQVTLPNITDSVLFTAGGVIASLFTTVVAVIVEHLFRIPPDVDEPLEGTPA